jgi:hypothetical protein
MRYKELILGHYHFAIRCEANDESAQLDLERGK